MSPPSYSVIVPTRDRPDTLAVTLRCLASLQMPRCQVVVVDNAGPADTAAVLRAAELPLTVARSDMPLSMRDSWEMGLAAATGDYVTVIGDDDSLVAHTFAFADRLLDRTPSPDILMWGPYTYWWPTALAAQEAGMLTFLFGPEVAILDTGALIQAWNADPWTYPTAPSIYQAFVSRRLIDAVRARFGRYFWEKLPDIGSAMTNLFEAHFSKRQILVSSVPLSLRGVSHQSFGQAYKDRARGAGTRDRFVAAETGDSEPVSHPALIETPALPAAIVSSWLRMMPRLAAAYGFQASIDIPNIAVQTALRMRDGLAAEHVAYDALAADVHALLRKHGVDPAGVPLPPRPAGPPPRLAPVLLHSGKVIQVIADLQPLGIHDTWGALQYLRTLTPQIRS